ncbi:MAG: DNA polymerase III subunit alpha, partial [Gammaproteobacteria bacterium]
RKHGRAKVEYPHPALQPLLEATYGVILYQEQVMQIAQVLSGYSLGGADLLRRAMGKKNPAAMAKQRQVFVDGARERGADPAKATQIFDLMEKFALYGFNKSHSAAYALLTYQTGWLKCHYPAAFMAAVLSADMDHTDKVVTIIEECRSLGLQVLAPDVNRCDLNFTPVGERSVRYGLGAIKGVGEGAVASILADREANGEFTDLFDFCCRIDTRKLNRRAIEAMIKAGALDALAPTRAACMASLTQALQAAEQVQRDAGAGQDDMFGGTTVEDVSEHHFANALDWSDEERLAGEKQTLGLYLSGHPIARFESELEQIVSSRLADLRPGDGASTLIAGFVVNTRSIKSRRGRMAVVLLDDRTARVEVVVYAQLYTQCQELLKNDRLIVIEGEVSADEFSGGCSVIANTVHDLDAVRAARARCVAVRVQACNGASEVAARQVADNLAELLAPHRGGQTPVCIEYVRSDATARVQLGEAWCVKPSNDLLSKLETLAGEGSVSLEY